MPWQTPTLSDLRRFSRDNIVARIPGADVSVPNSVLRVTSDNQAALARLVFEYLEWQAFQYLPDTSESEWLDRHADIWLPGGRKPASYADGSVLLSGTNGTIIPVATRLQSDTQLYETTEEIVLLDVATEVSVRALQGGSESNRDEGAPIVLSVAITNVNATGEIVTMTGGYDIEDDESLRGRILDRIQKPPMGGDKDDYEQWAKEVPGVTRAWSYPNEMGIGTVTVRFMSDTLDPVTGDIIEAGFPDQTLIDAVTEHIDERRPVTLKDRWVFAPVPREVDIHITSLSNDTASTRAAIEVALKKLFNDERMQPGQTVHRSWIDEAISSAIGEDHHETDYTSVEMDNSSQLPVLGSITYD